MSSAFRHSLLPGVEVALGDIARNRKVLANPVDPYIRRLTSFDLAVRLRRPVDVVGRTPASLESARSEFQERQVNNVVELREDFRATMKNKVLPFISKSLSSMQLAQSDDSLVRKALLRVSNVDVGFTTGVEEFVEEAPAAYCRGSGSIFLPRKMMEWPIDRLRFLFAHELWHVISRNLSHAERDLVYRQFGFVPLFHPENEDADLVIPHVDTLSQVAGNDGAYVRANGVTHRHISNPDCLTNRHALLLADGSAWVPLLLARHEYFLEQLKSPEDYFFFVCAQLSGSGWRDDGAVAVARDGEETPRFRLQVMAARPEDGYPDPFSALVMRSPASEHFCALIGRNTQYLCHVEELLADNFANLVCLVGESHTSDQGKGHPSSSKFHSVPSPEKLEGLLRVLSGVRG